MFYYDIPDIFTVCYDIKLLNVIHCVYSSIKTRWQPLILYLLPLNCFFERLVSKEEYSSRMKDSANDNIPKMDAL